MRLPQSFLSIPQRETQVIQLLSLILLLAVVYAAKHPDPLLMVLLLDAATAVGLWVFYCCRAPRGILRAISAVFLASLATTIILLVVRSR